MMKIVIGAMIDYITYKFYSNIYIYLLNNKAKKAILIFDMNLSLPKIKSLDTSLRFTPIDRFNL